MNDRLQIAAMAMQTLLKRAKKPFTFQEIAHDALGYADAIIAAAGEGGMSEKPTSHSEPIKSGWSIRSCFEGLREWQNRANMNEETITLTRERQDELCDLVEKHYGYPKPSVPSVQEINKFLLNQGLEHNINRARAIHQWLTERGAK